MSRTVVIVLIFVLGGAALGAESAEMLLQRAMHKQTVEGNVSEAIRLYREVVAKHAANRPVAAKALYLLGEAYEKLGKAEAAAAYERLVREYGDQTAEARKAASRLAALRRPQGGAAVEGMRAQRIWDGADVDALGSPSADGSFLSFVDWETGDVALRDLRSGAKRRLTNKGSWSESLEFAEFSAVSPDGKHVAYSWFADDGRFELRAISTSGGEPRVLLRGSVAYTRPYAWTPDGKQVFAFIEQPRGNGQLALLSMDGGIRRVRALDWRFPMKADLSPSGRLAVYDLPIDEESPNRDLFLLDLESGEEHALVSHPAVDSFPLFSPDGKQVVFISDRTGTAALWSVDVENGRRSGEPQLIRADMGRTSLIGFSRDRTLYYEAQKGLPDVHMLAIDGETGTAAGAPARAVQKFVGRSFAPDWSPDGKYLSYSSQRLPMGSGSGARVLVIQSLDSGATRELVPRLTYFQRPRWTPDGRYLTATAAQKGKHGFYNIDATTGEASPLLIPPDGVTVHGANWARDGRTVYYTRTEGRTQQVAALDLSSGAERIVLAADRAGMLVNDIAISPDDRFLAARITYGEGGSSSIHVISIATGEKRQLVGVEDPKFVPGMAGIAWSPDGRYIYYVIADGLAGKRALWRVPADGGEPMPVGIELEQLRDVRMHPSGKRLALTTGTSQSEIWTLHDFLPQRGPARRTAAKRE